MSTSIRQPTVRPCKNSGNAEVHPMDGSCLRCGAVQGEACRPMTFGIPRIRTDFVYPPIPIRTMDWQATYDDYDGAEDSSTRGEIGEGATETEAICDLIENHPRED